MGLVLKNDNDPTQSWSIIDSDQRCLIAAAPQCYASQVEPYTGPDLVAHDHCECRDGPCTSKSDLHCRSANMGVSGLLRACNGIVANQIESDVFLRSQLACSCRECSLTYPGCVWAAGGDLAVCGNATSCVDGFTADMWTAKWPPACWGSSHYGLMGLVGAATVLGGLVALVSKQR